MAGEAGKGSALRKSLVPKDVVDANWENIFNNQYTNPNVRVVQVLNDGAWERVALCNVESGQIFRMFEPDGIQVTCDGCDAWVAECDGATDESGLHFVKISRALKIGTYLS